MSEDRLINYFESYRKDRDAYEGAHRREKSSTLRETKDYQKAVIFHLRTIGVLLAMLLGAGLAHCVL